VIFSMASFVCESVAPYFDGYHTRKHCIHVHLNLGSVDIHIC